MFATAFDKRGNRICTVANSYERSHPLQKKYSSRVGKPKQIYLHAEIRALVKAKALGRKIYRLEVARFNARGEPVLAKPCAACAMALLEAGVVDITYTTGDLK